MKAKLSQEYYDDLMAKLPGVEISYIDAGNLAEEFLKASYKAMCERKEIENEIVALEIIQDSAFAKAIEQSEGSKITEKKEMAKTNQEYIRAKMRHGEAVNNSSFLKECIKLFENAHIFYRATYKGKFGD